MKQMAKMIAEMTDATNKDEATAALDKSQAAMDAASQKIRLKITSAVSTWPRGPKSRRPLSGLLMCHSRSAQKPGRLKRPGLFRVVSYAVLTKRAC
jgi:hypothetical protein